MTRGTRKSAPAAAFAGTGWSFRDVPLDNAALAQDATDLLGALDRGRGYQAFLDRARAANAAGGTPDIDRQVLAQARLAQADSGAATASAARMLRSMHVGGALAGLTASTIRSLQAGGPVKAGDLWALVRSTEGYRAILDRWGMTEALMEEVDAIIARTDLILSADGPGAIVAGSIDGEPVLGRLSGAPPAARLPRDPVGLLTTGRFLALCDVLERQEGAYLLGAGARRDITSLEDLLMSNALAGQREAVRHIRELEDIGLATHAGGLGPLAIGLIILGITLLGGLLVLAECEEETLGGEQSFGCDLGRFLFVIGLGIILAWSAYDKQTTLNTLGGQSLSGPLPQLQGTGS